MAMATSSLVSSDIDEDHIQVKEHYDFTLCFNEDDREVAEKILTHLENEFRLKGFYEPRDGPSGMTKMGILEMSIEQSEVIFVILSHNCMKCHWYERQVHIALQESLDNHVRRNSVVPIFLGIKKYQAPTALKTIAGVDFNPDPSSHFWTKMRRLFNKLKMRSNIDSVSSSSSIHSTSSLSSCSGNNSTSSSSGVNNSSNSKSGKSKASNKSKPSR